MASPVRIFRKILGYVLILINLLLSFISFTAVYSVVYFMGNRNNIEIDPLGADLQPSLPTPYLYLGTITINNTGLFEISDLSFEFEVAVNDTPSMKYNGSYGSIPSQTKTPLSLNLTDSLTGDLWLNTPFPTNWTGAVGFLSISGRYAFSLFGFNLNITDLTAFITLV